MAFQDYYSFVLFSSYLYITVSYICNSNSKKLMQLQPTVNELGAKT